jgi:4'-phosphopantetheinyl transferase
VRIVGGGAVASVTYAGGRAVVAVCDDGAVASIGIDAEAVADARRDAAGMRGVLGTGEASIRSWTRVEAALKADGRGLRVDPGTVRIDEHAGGWSAQVPGSAPSSGWDVEDIEGLIVSVAVRVSAAGAEPSDPATR